MVDAMSCAPTSALCYQRVVSHIESSRSARGGDRGAKDFEPTSALTSVDLPCATCPMTPAGGGDTGSYVSHAVHVAALSRFTDAYACDDLNARVAAVREHLGIVPSEGRYTTACDKLVPLNPNVVIFVYIQLIVVATCVGLVAAKKL